MKKGKNSKKDFHRFTGRSSEQRRKNKERSKAVLAALAAETGVRTEGAVFGDLTERPSRRHTGAHPRKFRPSAEEECATGTFAGTASGFGFVRIPGRAEDVFVPAGACGGAITGDTVEVRFTASMRHGEEKTEGYILRVTEGIRTVIGTLCADRSRRPGKKQALYLSPDDRNLTVLPVVTDAAGALPGDKVLARLDRTQNPPTATVEINFGAADSREANYQAILTAAGIEVDFSPAAAQEAEEAARKPLHPEERADLTDEIIFTIDGADAKDLDDAVSLSRLPDGTFRLGVHIADVSYYVEEGSALEEETMRRGTSVYFTDKVVPMLPPCLSNGACSLNAGEPKATLSADILLSPMGDILRTTVRPALIRSRVRGVYSEINDLFAKGKRSDFYGKYREVLPTLTLMRSLAAMLARRGKERGALNLSTPEAKILLDARGMPCDIVRVTTGEAEGMIEQFMLTANEGVAALLFAHEMPCVYRIHEAPPPEKIHTLVPYLHHLGFDAGLIREDNVSGTSLNAVLRAAEERGIAEAVSLVILRSMSKAVYAPVCRGHFGLGILRYCHFTSPIRRLSDLATHRILRRVLLGGASPRRYEVYARRAADMATEAELRALTAERRIDALYKVLYMQDKIGQSFSATVSSVTSFGVFCTLPDTVEGLIPLASLPGVFRFDEETLTLRSRQVSYHLGDRVTVLLEEADLIGLRLRFSDVRFAPGYQASQENEKAGKTAGAPKARDTKRYADVTHSQNRKATSARNHHAEISGGKESRDHKGNAVPHPEHKKTTGRHPFSPTEKAGDSRGKTGKHTHPTGNSFSGKNGGTVSTTRKTAGNNVKKTDRKTAGRKPDTARPTKRPGRTSGKGRT